MNENNNINNNLNNDNKSKTTWKDVLLYVIMIIIIIIIILLMCKYCQLTKANKQHVIKPTTSAQTTTINTTTELITETTTTIPTSEAVTEATTRLTTKKTNYDVPNTTVNRQTTSKVTQGTIQRPTTNRPTTNRPTTTTIKKDVYTYKYQIQTSETKSFYILKNGVRMNAYILVFDNNNNPITFSNNGVGSGLTMVNSNIDLGKCPTIKFRVCDPQGLNCGETFTASC